MELYFTLAFDLEIILRFASFFPDWRSFIKKGENYSDLFIAIMTSAIQIPVIHSSAAYPWLTVFQIVRFGRVILAIPRMRRLVVSVFGHCLTWLGIS
jgi:hypothetical protein